jgi:hypothetical protein
MVKINLNNYLYCVPEKLATENMLPHGQVNWKSANQLYLHATNRKLYERDMNKIYA